MEDLSKQGSHIPQHARRLWIHGPVPWRALPTLVKLLPAQVAALSSIAIPIVAIVSGILLLKEPLSALQAVAIGSTVISLWLALVPRRAR